MTDLERVRAAVHALDDSPGNAKLLECITVIEEFQAATTSWLQLVLPSTLSLAQLYAALYELRGKLEPSLTVLSDVERTVLRLSMTLPALHEPAEVVANLVRMQITEVRELLWHLPHQPSGCLGREL